MTEARGGGRRTGLLIDFGGVLTRPIGPAFGAFCLRQGIPESSIDELMVDPSSPLTGTVHAFERGEIEETELIEVLDRSLGTRIGPDLGDLFTDLELDLPMFALVGALRDSGVRTCLLSNAWGTAVYPRQELAAVFDELVISAEVGMRKPEPEIYEFALRAIDLRPEECVFVDDLEFNLGVASDLGLATVHHVTYERTVAALEAMFAVNLQV